MKKIHLRPLEEKILQTGIELVQPTDGFKISMVMLIDEFS